MMAYLLGKRETRHFGIGVVNASLTTGIRPLLEQYSSIYGRCETQTAGKNEIAVSVRRRPPSLRRRRRFEVAVNGRVQFEPLRFDELLPYIEWSLNWEVPRVMPQYLQLHACSMEFDGAGVIFPGASGAGKSTLTLGFLTRGWRYLCDEFALVHADTLQLHPYPRAICIKRAGFAAVEALGIAVSKGRHHLKGAKGYVSFISPTDVRADAVGRPCPIRYVIFPRFEAGAAPELRPMTRSEAAFQLHYVCFNLLRCRAVGLDVIAGLIRGAACYRLTTGDLRATCALVEQTIRRDNREMAQTA